MAKQNKFGTFGGVFVPSILTILGVIMYLRLPTIVGEAGLWATIGIIAIAHIISATTGLSVSSIATDKKVEAGGTYYMISRSLGLPIGGTLGLALFVGLSFSVSLYLIGFSESFLGYWGWSTDINNIRLTGSIVLLIVTTVTFISTSLAIKTQYFILAAIVLSLLSIFIGGSNEIPASEIVTDALPPLSFMALFGIFFPAVTGFEAGVSMSGDLQDPKKSIPGGSIAAIIVGFVVYIILTIFLNNTVSPELLKDKEVLFKISWIPWLVVAGIWGATLSSALGSILGAPRILQATAVDRISPKFFAKGYGPTNEPRNALLFTFLIAEAGILIGELNVIARIVSIFFITTYGFLNISAAFEKWTSADFRPEFKVSGWISVIGFAACLIVMILLDFVAMLGAVIILGLLFLYLKRKELTLDSGDAWSGVWASLVKRGLTNLKKNKLHNRNWRPNIIMFSGEQNARAHMIEIGRSVTGKLGVLSAFNLIKSEAATLAKTESNLSEEDETTDYFEHKLYTRDVYDGMDEIARVYGFSGVEPNTVLMGWSRRPESRERFVNLMSNFKHYKYNCIFLNYNQERKFGKHQTIDIWWSGTGKNLAFAISLMQSIVNSVSWKQTKIRLLIVNPVNREAENVYKSTTAILQDYRVDAEVRIVNNEIDPLSDGEIIRDESKDTDLVILGVPDQKYAHLDHYYQEYNQVFESIGSALVINASGDFEEFEVISESSSKGKSIQQEAALLKLELPAIKPSKYSEIAEDIVKVDTHGQKVMELFHRKTFQPIISDHLKIVSELSDKVEFIDKELDKIIEIGDTFRKKKAIDKLKNDFLFKVNELYTNQLKETLLPRQLTQLQDGIAWYEERLNSDFERFPAKLKVEYNVEDFEVNENDTSSFKFYKWRKRLGHSMFNKPITQRLRYRDVARHYQFNNRKVFLNEILVRFEQDVIEFYEDLRRITNDAIAYLDEVERQIWAKSTNWQDKERLEFVKKVISKEAQDQQNLSKLQLGRLQLEFRKNLQNMSNELEKTDVNRTIKKKFKPAKYYRELMSTAYAFPDNYDLNVRTLLNMILMELSVNSTKNRIEDLHIESNESLKRDVEQNFLKSLDNIEKKIIGGGLETDFKKLKVDGEFEAGIQQVFIESHDRMMSLVENMPERVEIYSTKTTDDQSYETVVIPVARMAEYYIQSYYETVVEERFEILMDVLRRSVFTIKDLLNLTQFKLENTDFEHQEEKDNLLKDCVASIEEEKAMIVEKIDEYIQFANDQFAKAFDPLSSMKIEESASDFSYDLRNFQGQKVLTGINQVTEQVTGFFRNLIIRIFYSRSTGVLLTKKFTRSKELDSFGSRLLDIKEKVSPSEQILRALPPYYVTLFNGKSNISSDFWVPRVAEEAQFNQAIKRYNEGYTGGILILGDRNAGKTAFCKYVVSRYLKQQVVYTIFPPVQGSSTVEGFTQSLRKATYKTGTVDQIISQLDKGSVLVINDLELFWERDVNGLDVINLLSRLIDEYGQHILFVVNLNPHAYKLINRMTGLGDRFIENINFGAFDAEGLKDIIMRRHRSSGLELGWKEGDSDLNGVQQAQLFNIYFSYCEGVPGTALNGWLANIKKVTSKGLIIKRPQNPSIAALKELNEDWVMVLMQFVLHKRLDPGKIARISGWEITQVNSLILAMLRAGVIVEKAPDIYNIDPYVHPFVVKALQEKEIL